jgi:hypothetical protein
MKVFAPSNGFQCGHCLTPLEVGKLCHVTDQASTEAWCPNDDKFSNITGELLQKGCPRFGLKMKIHYPTIDCDAADTEGDANAQQ